MGDVATYAAICAETLPKECKRLGRSVANWDEARYQVVVGGIAVCILDQKFAASPHLTKTLFQTENKVLAEATAGDQRWAIRISIKMPKVYEVPAR